MVACRSSDIPAIYTYNGLGHRISEKTDTGSSGGSGRADGVVDKDDPVFFIAVDPQGRRVATFRGTDDYPKETFVYHPNGVRGPAFTGGVLLRDRNSDLTDPTLWAGEAGGRFRTERTYYCTDFRGNVAALIDDAGALVEQYAYSQSGVPFGLPLGNVKSDGKVDAAHSSGTDWDIINTISGGAYQARADLNLDGVVDSADLAIVTAQDGIATGRGKLAAPATGNRKAFSQGEVFGEGYNSLSIRGNVFVHLGSSLRLRGTFSATVVSSMSALLYSSINVGYRSNTNIPSAVPRACGEGKFLSSDIELPEFPRPWPPIFVPDFCRIRPSPPWRVLPPGSEPLVGPPDPACETPCNNSLATCESNCTTTYITDISKCGMLDNLFHNCKLRVQQKYAGCLGDCELDWRWCEVPCYYHIPTVEPLPPDGHS